MKILIHWLLIFLIAFEPAMAATARAQIQDEFKKFIELSEITKHEVSFKQLYDKFSSSLPYMEQQRLKPFIKNFGHLTLPKMDLAKIKTGKEEVYRIVASFGGKVGAMEFYGDETNIFKINGKSFSVSDARSTGILLSKLGLDQEFMNAYFTQPAEPAKIFLSADEIRQLNREDQIKYIRNFQDLLVSLEAVDLNSQRNRKKTSQLIQKLEFYSQLFLQEYAFAMEEGDDCLAAGHMAKVRKSATGLKCGVMGGSNNIDTQWRHTLKGVDCGGNRFACNANLFGEKAGEHCVPAGKDSTKLCRDFSQANGNDIPDITKENKAQFEELRKKAQDYAAKVAGHCDPIKSAKTGGADSGLIDDQKKTCAEFEQRLATIKNWSCDESVNKDFKNKYPKLCAAENSSAQSAQAGSAAPPAAQVGTNTPAAQQAQLLPLKLEKCGSIKDMRLSLSDKCEGGYEGRPDDKELDCLGSDEKPVGNGKIYQCFCPNDGAVERKFKNKCNVIKPMPETSSSSGKTKSWLKRNSDWLPIVGFGLLGLFMFHWMTKKSIQTWYNYLNPTTPVAPVAPTNPSAPVPRSAK